MVYIFRPPLFAFICVNLRPSAFFIRAGGRRASAPWLITNAANPSLFLGFCIWVEFLKAGAYADEATVKELERLIVNWILLGVDVQ